MIYFFPKQSCSLLLAVFGLCAVSAFHGCGESEKEPREQTETTGPDKTGPEYTSAYICPMHCKGSGNDQPGVCPVCGMDYVANSEKP